MKKSAEEGSGCWGRVALLCGEPTVAVNSGILE
jgi:hypothetical protein